MAQSEPSSLSSAGASPSPATPPEGAGEGPSSTVDLPKPPLRRYVTLAILIFTLLLWGLGYLVGLSVTEVRTAKKGVLNITEYWSLMFAGGQITFSAGVNSVPHPSRPIGPDGWSCFLGSASRFQPVQPSPRVDATARYHLGDRWLPVGSRFTLPFWTVVLAAFLLAVACFRISP